MQIVQLNGDASGNLDRELEPLTWPRFHVESAFRDRMHVQAVNRVAADLEHDWLPDHSLSLRVGWCHHTVTDCDLDDRPGISAR